MFNAIFKKNKVLIKGDNTSDKINIVEEELHGIDIDENVSKKKKPDILQVYRCLLCDKCYRREYYFMRNIVNQSSMMVSCGLVENNLEGRKSFSNQINNN